VGDRGVFSTQVGWLTAGIAILMVSLYCHVSLVIRGRRAIGERRAAMVSDGLADLVPSLVGQPATEMPAEDGQAVSGVVVVEGLDLFHEPGCAMTAGRDVMVISRGEAVAQGLNGCGICCRRSASRAVVGGRSG